MPRKPATIRRMQNAIKENDIALMREAIADGADVNRKDRDGYPYLTRALLESYYDIGYYDIAKLLIESGVDVNLRGKNDMTAICRAVSSGNVEMVRMLIEYGADVNVAEPPVMITPLHWACRADSRLKKHYTEDVRTSIVSMLIDHGADVNARERHGEPPLLYACYLGYPETARLLLERGADPEAESNFSISPFDAVLKLKEDNPAREELIELFQEYAPDIVFGKFCTMNMAPGMVLH
ncbi:MAG: ankyrin repeat domain-containing protein [Syntrophorhabdaceae bacterium]|nr:ankyrin repeat domain-containing protein [Syntrophorhabdaceae bacterium]